MYEYHFIPLLYLLHKYKFKICNKNYFICYSMPDVHIIITSFQKFNVPNVLEKKKVVLEPMYTTKYNLYMLHICM